MKSDLERAREADQDTRRVALIERIGTIADLCSQTPLSGDLGDVAYDLLRKAAAQISSDRQRLAFAKSECATRDAEIERLTAELRRCEEWFARVRPATDEANHYLNEDGWDDMASIHDAARTALSNKDAG